MSTSNGPVVPRPAATVMLLRDGDHGLEVFLQRRAAAMAFAADMTAFPGGGVDERDRRRPTAWHGPDPIWWADRLGCTEDLASALVFAAVRETFEECGVLLAATAAGTPLTVHRRELMDTRRRMVEERLAVADVLDANGWVLRADMLRPWSNWITPEVRPRRYDTRFFVAAVPEGQSADGSTTEATAVSWSRPGDALTACDEGTMQLMLPTRTCLEELVDVPDIASAFRIGEKRPIAPIRPAVTNRDGREVVTLRSHPR